MTKASNLQGAIKTMGTLPVFMTAVSTILGAILFLKFGYAIGHVGLLGTLAIILIGHLVTIPTAMAVAEIATNQKVEGGGAYYIISRSFGLNIGGAIGIALFLAQAISIAFYIIAFTESLEILRQYVMDEYGKEIFKETITFSTMGLLAVLILTRGANVGVKALYVVVVILVVSLIMFFMGSSVDYDGSSDISRVVSDGFVNADGSKGPKDFFYVFAIIFPAFTGIAAGLGLSGDLKDPKKAIPRGTLWATVVGLLVYIAVAFKLFYSANPETLANEDTLVMSKIAIWGPIISVGLACAAISSALGSIMIAPRTLQALAVDKVLPGDKVNKFLGKGRNKDNEPINASIITVGIAFFFCSLGDINAVAEIISMFFMVTYGAICMVSFFEHFAADPSYRPTFKSRWWLSLMGGLLCFWLMFQMNPQYAIGSILMMVGFYVWITSTKKNTKDGLANLFKGVIFQISRTLQIFLQRREQDVVEDNWRPFVICISPDSFKRSGAFSMVSWISHKYGFGTYMHYIEGGLSETKRRESNEIKQRLIQQASGVKSRVYLDTIISPSYTSAIAQAVQLPGISGKGNNMFLVEYSDTDEQNLSHLRDNYEILKSSEMDICILRTSYKGFGFKKNIHIWITTTDFLNGNLMILLGYIILGHPEWKTAEISIYSLYDEGNLSDKKAKLHDLVSAGRLPISLNNIELIKVPKGYNHKRMINRYSEDADLTIVGFNDKDLDVQGMETFQGFDNLGNILFVNNNDHKQLS